MLQRILEPEVMDSQAEAEDYDSMDHREVNERFVTDLLAAGADLSEVLDLGTGTAQIPIELCSRATASVVAIDLAEWMLRVGEQNVRTAGFSDRIKLELVDGKGLPYPDARFSAVISNSIVQHMPAPGAVLAEAVRVAAPGAVLFFRDLLRPATRDELDRLVETYAGGANDHQRQMFAESLHAALSLDEMRSLLSELGFAPQTLQQTTDRHWTWIGRKS